MSTESGKWLQTADVMTASGTDVYLLGAGFSRAISANMPLLNDLGERVVERLSDDVVPRDLRLVPTDFELWLSYLSEDHPWLDEVDRLRNRATFVAASRALADVVAEREERVRSEPMPSWLRSLVARWHEDRATVITFNYDTLVEAAYTEVVTVKARPNSDDNYVSHVQLRRSPFTRIGMRAAGLWGETFIDTFTLVKLHGSRSWVYSGRASFYGETIYDVGRTRGWRPDDPDPLPWLSEDKVPLIVPPTAGKTGFFDNETVRAEWRRAHEALRRAKRVFVVGYSFPPSDLLVRFLLQQSCPPSAKITVVDPDEQVVARARDILRVVDAAEDVTSLRDTAELVERLPPADPAPVVMTRQ